MRSVVFRDCCAYYSYRMRNINFIAFVYMFRCGDLHTLNLVLPKNMYIHTCTYIHVLSATSL